MTRSLALLLVVATAAAPAACRRSGLDGESRPERPQGSRNDPYLIEGEELKSAETAQNLYEAVRIKRPAWLTKSIKGAEGRVVNGDDAVVVYLDDRQLGMLPVLRDLRVDLASKLIYLSPTQAQLRYGPRHGSLAAIVVEIPK